MAKSKSEKKVVAPVRQSVPDKKWVTLTEAARLVGITRGVFWYHVQKSMDGSGPKIDGVQFGGDGRWLFSLDSVYRFKMLPRTPGRKKNSPKLRKKAT